MSSIKFFSINDIFLYKETSLWKPGSMFFYNTIFITDRLNKVRKTLKNVSKSFEMTLNSKCGIEKNQS